MTYNYLIKTYNDSIMTYNDPVVTYNDPILTSNYLLMPLMTSLALMKSFHEYILIFMRIQLFS